MSIKVATVTIVIYREKTCHFQEFELLVSIFIFVIGKGLCCAGVERRRLTENGFHVESSFCAIITLPEAMFLLETDTNSFSWTFRKNDFDKSWIFECFRQFIYEFFFWFP